MTSIRGDNIKSKRKDDDVYKVKIGFMVGLVAFVLLGLPNTRASASTGCKAVDAIIGVANPSLHLGVESFITGDEISVTVTGPGNSFELYINGAPKSAPVAIGGTITYLIPANGDYDISVVVAGPTDATTTATFSCTPGPEQDPIDPDGDGLVTICHIPPGNPAAQHTITVGAPAVQAHLGHGDTLGPCPDGTDTRYDSDDGGGIAIFVMIIIGKFEVYGDCEGENCSLIISIDFDNVDLEVGENIFIDGDNSDDDGDDDYAMIYYLHPDPININIHIFQINIYEDNTLVNDSILLFVDENGNIVQWDTHEIWERRAEAAGLTN